MPRLKRPEQTALNRERVLEAAGKIFRRKGFHAASLEEIADEAGFSKGVIYSQFDSKDDLALTLIERRMEWRTGQTLELVQGPVDRALRDMWERNREIQRADLEWGLFVLEFRVHAARTPDVNSRYKAMHRKTLENLTRVFEALISRSGSTPRHAPGDLALFLSAIDAGAVLEAHVDAPTATVDVGHDAVRLLLAETTGPAGEGEDSR